MAVIIFKALETCNANCVYCEVVKKNVKEIMNYSLLKTVFKKMGDYLKEYPKETISFIWHGGEVALLGADYFQKAYEIQEKYCKNVAHRIKHQVQSNLTIITQELIDVFKKLKISNIGTSYEFVPGIRGFGEQRDSNSYNKLFFRGVELLKKNNMSFGIIYVVNQQTLKEPPLKALHFLTNMNLRTAPNLNKIYVYGSDTHNLDISQEEFADFLGSIFPYWYKHKEMFPSLSPFSQWYDNIVGKSKSIVCERSGRCAHNWLYVGPTGNLSHCGRAGDFEGDFFDYGNIQDSRTLYDYLHFEKRELFVKRQEYLINNDCKDCRFWGICHGGCLLDAYAEYNGDVMHPSTHCVSTKRFLEKYFEPITGIKIDFSPKKADFEAIKLMKKE